MAAAAEPPTEHTHSPQDSAEIHQLQLQGAENAQHEHSDSMVTIRLSDNPTPSTAPDGAVPSDKEEAKDLGTPIADEETKPEPHDAPVETNLQPSEESQAVGKSVPALYRASRVRFDMEEAVEEEEGSARDSIPISQSEEEQPDRSHTSSKSSFSQIEVDDVDTLETEMRNHANRVRSQSSGSSDSGSAQVDWAELDKNEEQEQRDEASEEVCLCRRLGIVGTHASLEHRLSPCST